MQKIHHERNLLQKNNYRTIQDYENPFKIRMQRKMETDWAQKMIKNHRIVICTHKTKYETP